MIAHDNGVLVPVEVKVRSSSALVPPQDLISPRKLKRLTIAAEAYISKINGRGEIRFGAITFIDGKSDNIKDAFWNYTYEKETKAWHPGTDHPFHFLHYWL